MFALSCREVTLEFYCRIVVLARVKETGVLGPLSHKKQKHALHNTRGETCFCHCNLRLLEQKGNVIEPQEVNPYQFDINKALDIPSIPQEETCIYSMLYEEMTAPSHVTRSRQRASMSSAPLPPGDDDIFESSAASESEDVEEEEKGEEEDVEDES